LGWSRTEKDGDGRAWIAQFLVQPSLQTAVRMVQAVPPERDRALSAVDRGPPAGMESPVMRRAKHVSAILTPSTACGSAVAVSTRPLQYDSIPRFRALQR